jgi:hypothetical protein
MPRISSPPPATLVPFPIPAFARTGRNEAARMFTNVRNDGQRFRHLLRRNRGVVGCVGLSPSRGGREIDRDDGVKACPEFIGGSNAPRHEDSGCGTPSQTKSYFGRVAAKAADSAEISSVPGILPGLRPELVANRRIFSRPSIHHAIRTCRRIERAIARIDIRAGSGRRHILPGPDVDSSDVPRISGALFEG